MNNLDTDYLSDTRGICTAHVRKTSDLRPCWCVVAVKKLLQLGFWHRGFPLLKYNVHIGPADLLQRTLSHLDAIVAKFPKA